MSPSGLVRNVPYTVTSRGGPVEEDSDEHEGTSAGRGNGAGEEQDAAVDRCGKDTGVELPADEETLEAVSRGRSEGSAAPQCGKRVEPCEDGKHTGSGERGGSTLVTWCSWMEVSMPGLKNEGLEVA